jgi:5-methylcytosine-specific restriction endonuclease McrA
MVLPGVNNVTKIIWGINIPVLSSKFKEWDVKTKKPIYQPCFRSKDFSFELCDICGEQVTDGRLSGGLTTCSTKCNMKKWNIKHDFIITKEREQKGKRPPRFWEIIKEECFKRDNYTCQKCKKTRNKLNELMEKEQFKEGKINKNYKRTYFILNAHHIRPISEGGNNIPDNLITLCGKCHKTEHSSDANIKRKHIGLELFGIVPIDNEG